MNPCKCGKSPQVSAIAELGFYVECAGTEYCWSGPMRETESEAIQAWDKLMGGEEPKPKRKPFGIIDTPSGVIVICDDGAVFVNPINHTNWVKRNPIPGTEADR